MSREQVSPSLQVSYTLSYISPWDLRWPGGWGDSRDQWSKKSRTEIEATMPTGNSHNLYRRFDCWYTKTRCRWGNRKLWQLPDSLRSVGQSTLVHNRASNSSSRLVPVLHQKWVVFRKIGFLKRQVIELSEFSKDESEVLTFEFTKLQMFIR